MPPLLGDRDMAAPDGRRLLRLDLHNGQIDLGIDMPQSCHSQMYSNYYLSSGPRST